MNRVGGIGGAGSVEQIIALRQQIIDRNQVLQQLHEAKGAGPAASVASPAQAHGGGFADTLKSALDGVNASQGRADQLSASYERGETTDIAKVMMARQESGVAFEATLQVRNKLLSAYQDIMRMGV
jgi:flagellar hook-basal body complex protein FliE